MQFRFDFDLCTASETTCEPAIDDREQKLNENRVENSILRAGECLQLDFKALAANVSYTNLMIQESIDSEPPIHFDIVSIREPGFASLTQSIQPNLSQSDITTGVYEGGFKVWECSIDLVSYMATLLRKGFSFPPKVMELGCGHGLPGIYALQNGARHVSFLDYNREVLELTTAPNIFKNAEAQCERVSLYAGSWDLVSKVMRKDNKDSKYDLILTAETLYTEELTDCLVQMIQRHLDLQNPKAIAFLATKRYYFGTRGGSQHFINLIRQTALLQAEIVYETADQRSNIREIIRVQAMN